MKRLLTIGFTAAACLVLATAANAQTTGGNTNKITRLITVGTAGGPTPRAGRVQSSNLLTVNGTPYVIDAGDGTARRLAKLKFNFRNLGTIFITHGHNDHTGGLGFLLSAQWIAQRTQPINVYGPPGTEGLVRAAVQYFSQDSDIRISDGSRTVPVEKIFFGHDVAPGVVFQDDNIKVMAVENTHFHFQPGSPAFGKYKSYSYRFETPDRVIVFTGDTGPSDAVAELAKGADVLVSEVGSIDDVVEVRKRTGQWDVMSPKERQEYIRHQVEEHLTPENVGLLAKKAGVKTVVLTHLLPRPDGADYTSFAAEVKKQFPGEVLIAKDLMEF